MRLLLIPTLFLAAAPAAAEMELSFYGGWAGAPAGGVTVSDDPAVSDRDVSLDGGIGDTGQLGLRGTWWSEGGFGLALDYSRFGEVEETGEGLSLGGMQTLTLNGMRRWEDAFVGVTPYVGAGVGLAMAEVRPEGASETEARGAAVSVVAGASVPLGDNWSVFGEYEGTYADVEGETSGGGRIDSESITNSINLGVSFSF